MATNQEFGQRLGSLIGQEKKLQFARRIGVSARQLSRYLAGQIPDPPILIRIAKVAGRSIDWLLLGQGAAEVLVETARDLRASSGDAPLGSAYTKAFRKVSRAEYVIMLEEAAAIAAEAPAVYQANATTILALIEHLQQLDEDERKTLSRFLEAIRSGDRNVRDHLINQMKLVERALTTRRARAKKTETA